MIFFLRRWAIDYTFAALFPLAGGHDGASVVTRTNLRLMRGASDCQKNILSRRCAILSCSGLRSLVPWGSSNQQCLTPHRKRVCKDGCAEGERLVDLVQEFAASTMQRQRAICYRSVSSCSAMCPKSARLVRNWRSARIAVSRPMLPRVASSGKQTQRHRRAFALWSRQMA